LRWVPISSWMMDPQRPAATIVEFQNYPNNEVALVQPDAMRAMLLANTYMNSGRESESLTWLARAESLQTDTTATLFRRSIGGKRNYVLASLSFKEGRFSEAHYYLLALLTTHPGDIPGHRMLAAVDESLSAHPGPR